MPTRLIPCSRVFAWISTFALLSACSFALADERPRPNVLFIMADDLNCDLGCYGHALVQSPNIDRLAKRGVRFERAYCNYPVCNPSRSSLLSGRRADSTGVVDNVTPPRSVDKLKDAVMLPQHFRQQGYRTIKVGKIFHTGDKFEDPQSWDKDIRETAEAKKPPAEQIVKRDALPGAEKNSEGVGIVLRAKDEDAWDGKVARQAVELLEEYLKSKAPKPLFLAVGFRRPHTPYIAPEKYFALYPPEKMKPAKEPAEHLKNIPPIALTYKPGSKRPTETGWRNIHQAYYASLSYMDAQVGVLLDALDRFKLWENTVVVFISDHGYHLGEHGGLWHKMTLFEEGTRVPLIVAAPGKKTAVCDKLVELVDLYPSLADLCGLPAQLGLEGTSFTPLLDNPKRPWKKAVFTVVSRVGDTPATQKLDANKLGISVRTERYRYTEWPDGSRELYDHQNDPKEYKNLVGLKEHDGTLNDQKKILNAGWKGSVPEK